MSGSKDRRTFTINNSTSKSQWAFGKESRFPTQKYNTKAFGYETKHGFGHLKGSNAGRGFSTS